MRTYAIMVAILIIGLGMAYPHDTDPCAENRSLYAQYFQAGMYEDSRDFWLEALDVCGGPANMDFKFFKNGRSIYNKLRESIPEDDPAYQANLDTICWIYEEGLKHDYIDKWPYEYASFMVNFKYDERDKIDSLFVGHETDLMVNESHFIHYHFQHLILNHYNKTPSEDKGEVRHMIIPKYFLLYRKCLIAEYTSDGFTSTKDFLDKYFLMIQTKDMVSASLYDFYEELSDTLPLRIKEVKHGIHLMDKKECEKNETYAMYVEEQLRLEPSTEGYVSLGELYLSQKMYDKATEAFQKALEFDPDNQDEYNYYLARTLFEEGKYSRAFNKAKEVGGEYKGKALQLCGDCVAVMAKNCGDSTFDRKANYWLANDYYKMAKQAGENVSSTKYLDKAPSQDECWEENKELGDIIECTCWKETTKVRY